MGSRPSQFKKGGGFLNGVDGVIADYTFTGDVPSKDGPVPFKPGKDKGKERFHSLQCLLSVRPDGATEDLTQFLFAGGFEDFEISEDGKTLTAADGGPCNLSGNSDAAKFFGSLCDAGFPESNFSDDEASINFEPAIGTRVRFVQRRDEEATKKFGKRKDKKTGKEYDRTNLVVDQVYDLPQAHSKSNGKAKAAAAPMKGKTTKAAPPPPADEIDLPEVSEAALVEILTKAGKPIAKAKLSMATLTTPALKGQPYRDEVREWLFDDDNLEGLAGKDDAVITFNKSKGLLALVD